MIGLLDIGMGNLRSVANAIHQQGFEPRLVQFPPDLDGLTHLILPGVGQFSTAMQRVDASELRQPVRAFAASGRPVLGICLGMQLLATAGTEGGDSTGFDLVPGTVRRLPSSNALRIPHVGWNSARLTRKHPVLEGLKPDRDFYFVHSYVFDGLTADCSMAYTEYGVSFPSIVGRANVIGFQFHPEKSQANGLRLIENFCKWNGTC